MSMDLIVTQKQNFQILIHCPATGERVLGNSLKHFSIQNRKGTWWYCPACQGWHVLVYAEDRETSEELYNPRMHQLCLTSA